MMKKSETFYISMLMALMVGSMPTFATPDPQKVKDATAIWRAAIEPGVTPAEPKKYKVVKKLTQKGNAQGSSASAIKNEQMSGDDVVPGTNMGAMILDKLKVREQVTPETTALFGETIDLNTGSLSLQQVDISIPGNFDIPVEFRRIYKGSSYSFYSNLTLGEWNIAIPSVSTTTIMDHMSNPQVYSGSWGAGEMCSGQFNPGNFRVGGTDIAAGDYWSGETLDIPGVISEKIQAVGSSRFIKNWRFSCMTLTVDDKQMEGIKATSPQGVTYEFTQPKLIPTTPITAVNGLGLEENVRKYHAFLLVSKITDRFGNSVSYNYTNGQLASISSSDNRLITIQYETNQFDKNRVKTVIANGQTWHYRYQNANHSSNNDSLTEVERPDGRMWQFNLDRVADMPSHTMKATERDYYYGFVGSGGDIRYVLTNIVETQCKDLGTGSANGYLIHPNGARLDLAFSATRFGRTQVPNVLADFRFKTHANDLCYLTNAVVSKTLSGPGLSEMNWQYKYSQNKGAWIARINGETDVGEVLTGLAATPTDYNLLDLRSTSITTPDGAKTVHVFSRRWDHTDGQEVATEYYDTNGTTLLRRIERQFAAKSTNGSVGMDSYTGNELGTPYKTDNPAPHENYINKTSETVTNFPGNDRFTTEFKNYNAYGVPTQTVENNTLGQPERVTDTVFDHDLTNWVLNLETRRRVTQAGESVVEREATFYPKTSREKSLLHTESRYGQKVVDSHQYNVDPNGPETAGTLKKTTFAMTNRFVEFASYKRGKAQSITLPNRYLAGTFTVNLAVNNSGTIAWSDDLNGNRTHYQYDSLNRLTLIDPADSQWLNTSITYDNDTSGSGALVQNITRGNYCKSTRLDALMQPVLSKEWDSSNESQTVRYVNQRFNAYGKASFTSVPSASPSETFGSTTDYDGLQRMVNQTNTANGDQSYSYGSANSITVTNGKGYNTTTSYLAFGTPSTEFPRSIQQPEGVSTRIDYNIANLPSMITQGTVTELRRYNSQMQLCLLYRPETGTKAMEYNALGQVTRFAEGLSGSGGHCGDYTSVPNSFVTQSYDNLGDAWVTSFGDGTATKTATLDRQGNLKTLVNGSNSWNYDYNSLNLPYQQNLTLDGKTFSITHGYNNHGHLQTKTYAGATLAYAPNALGLPTQVADSQNYANNVLYYPNGQVKSYTYGNGLTFSQTLDAQFKPYERQVKSGSTLRAGQRYRYDNNDNLDAITDLATSSQSISLTFDGLDRLDTAHGVWGSGNFDYDTLSNLTVKQLGTQNLSYVYHPSTKRLSTVTGGYSFIYDDRGNVIGNGKRGFQFNRANQLVSSGTIGYQYDGHGRRVKKTGSSSGYSIYDLSGTLLLSDGPNGQTRFIHLGKDLIAKVGSAAALEDKPGYTGHVEDKDLSLTYMQARYYDPVIGRFYSNDPVDFMGHMQRGNPTMGFNRYAYANNNPYKFTDPDGKFINFAVNFAVNVAVEATIQYATTGSVDVGSAVSDAAVGMINPAKALDRIATVASIVQKGCSFDAQTMVLTKNGLKPIIDIKVGDKVWARNDVTQEENWQEVVANFSEHHKHVRALSIKAPDGKVETLITTDEHPFYHTQKRWLPSVELNVGDKVLAKNGMTLTVTQNKAIEREQLAYNLTVANDHTYFVGQHNAWVHNACKFPDAKQIAKQLGTNEKTFHKEVKAEIKADHKEEMKAIGTKNPDIGVTDDNNIALKNPQTKEVIETKTPLESYSRDQ